MSKRRRFQVLIVTGALAAIAAFTAVEVYEDGLSPWVLATGALEASMMVLPAAAVVALYDRMSRQRSETARLVADLARAREQGAEWRRETRTILSGLGSAIDRQLVAWGLTGAEREVGILLLKGLSLKEIAGVRGSSERTVRQQARSVYAKGGLSGRAALSAFFLEDLLPPPEVDQSRTS